MERNLRIRDFNLSVKALKRLSKTIGLSAADVEWSDVRKIVDILLLNTEYTENIADGVGTIEFKLSSKWDFILTIVGYDKKTGIEQIHSSSIDIQCKKRTKEQQIMMVFDEVGLPETYRGQTIKELLKIM